MRIQNSKFNFRPEFRSRRIQNFSERERGSALVMTLIILSMGLVISLSLSVIFLNQLMLSKQIELSAKAFAAADSGIEEALYQDRVAYILGDNIDFTGVMIDPLQTNANKIYCLDGSGSILNDFSLCAGEAYQYHFLRTTSTVITATGKYKGVKRILQVFY